MADCNFWKPEIRAHSITDKKMYTRRAYLQQDERL